jgi:hypothetical protein
MKRAKSQTMQVSQAGSMAYEKTVRRQPRMTPWGATDEIQRIHPVFISGFFYT